MAAESIRVPQNRLVPRDRLVITIRAVASAITRGILRLIAPR